MFSIPPVAQLDTSSFPSGEDVRWFFYLVFLICVSHSPFVRELQFRSVFFVKELIFSGILVNLKSLWEELSKSQSGLFEKLLVEFRTVSVIDLIYSFRPLCYLNCFEEVASCYLFPICLGRSKETLLAGYGVTEYNLSREMLIKLRSQLSRFKDKLSHNIYLVHSIVFWSIYFFLSVYLHELSLPFVRFKCSNVPESA